VVAAVFVRSRRWKKGKKTFGLRLQCAASNVHFQSKSRKVVVDQFHSALHVLSSTKWEGTITIINKEALQYFVCDEFL